MSKTNLFDPRKKNIEKLDKLEEHTNRLEAELGYISYCYVYDYLEFLLNFFNPKRLTSSVLYSRRDRPI